MDLVSRGTHDRTRQAYSVACDDSRPGIAKNCAIRGDGHGGTGGTDGTQRQAVALVYGETATTTDARVQPRDAGIQRHVGTRGRVVKHQVPGAQRKLVRRPIVVDNVGAVQQQSAGRLIGDAAGGIQR